MEEEKGVVRKEEVSWKGKSEEMEMNKNTGKGSDRLAIKRGNSLNEL